MKDQQEQLQLTKESQRMSHRVERLVGVSRNDNTVASYMQLWRQDHFTSFEHMLCELVSVLVREKKNYQKLASEYAGLRAGDEIVIPREPSTPISPHTS